MDAQQFAVVISPWSSHGQGSLTSRLALAVRHAISAGLLRSGDRLPAERELARALHVSRPTVSAIMGELREAGLVSSRQGSGTWVAEASPTELLPVPFAELLHKPGRIDLAAGTAPDAAMLPPVRIDLDDLLAAEPANGLNPVGLTRLREAIADRSTRWVPELDAENIIVTSGAHQALALLVATLVPRGAVVLVEEVTYGGLIDIAEANGARVVGIEMDDFGPKPDSLRELLVAHRPAMVVLVSSVHSPTGKVTPPDRSASIAEILKDTDATVVIDETYADLEFIQSDRTLSSILGSKALRVGSLSKTAWLGLRTGWIAAPRSVCESIVRRRWSQFDLGPSVPSQLVAHQVMSGLDDLIVRRRSTLIERAEWLRTALGDNFPKWSVVDTEGGLATWVGLPNADSSPFVVKAQERGVSILPGSACRADRGFDPHIRICFDRPIELLAEAIDRLVG